MSRETIPPTQETKRPQKLLLTLTHGTPWIVGIMSKVTGIPELGRVVEQKSNVAYAADGPTFESSGSKLLFSETAKEQNSERAKQRKSKTAKEQNSKRAKERNSETAKLPQVPMRSVYMQAAEEKPLWVAEAKACIYKRRSRARKRL